VAIIKPFRGYLPPSELARKVSSPPYDVISSDEAREIILNNPDSFLRVIKPEIDYASNSDIPGNILHQHAKDNLQDFIESGKLLQDDKPCFYLYEITMGCHTQTGIMAAVSVTEYNNGNIKKHEFTRPDKEDDRTEHIEMTNANTGPVFLTFSNDGEFQHQIESIKNKTADISLQADDNTLHNLWKIPILDDQISLITYFESIPALYIADGHHRAASASRVQRIREAANSYHKGDEPYNFFLSVIFPHDEMQIMDYNRVVKDLNGLTDSQFINLIQTNFNLTALPNAVRPNMKNIFSMFLLGSWYKLKAKDEILSDDPVEGLDASILQNHLLEPLLGINDPRTDVRIDFIGGIRGLEELENRCSLDTAVAFALYPVSIENLLAVADANKVMPPKSTWFEPKLRSGLVVRLLD